MGIVTNGLILRALRGSTRAQTRRQPHSLSFRFLVLAGASLLLTALAPRANAEVDADTSWTGAVDTTWNNAGNWTAGGPPLTIDTAVFNSAFTNQPNVTISRTVGSLHMATGVAQNVTISSSAAQILTIEGVGILGTGILIDNTSAFTLKITARVGLDASQTWTNNSGNLFTVSGATLGLGEDNTLVVNGTGNTLISAVIDGAGMGSSIIKDGSGTLTITRNNAYSGGTTVNGGTLLVNNTLVPALVTEM